MLIKRKETFSEGDKQQQQSRKSSSNLLSLKSTGEILPKQLTQLITVSMNDSQMACFFIDWIDMGQFQFIFIYFGLRKDRNQKPNWGLLQASATAEATAFFNIVFHNII